MRKPRPESLQFRGSRISTLFVLCAGATLVVLGPAMARGEEDHLQAYKVKDPAKFQPPGTYTVDTDNGTATCELKGAKLVLVQGEKNNGDDPRGGPAGTFVCYKAKCSGGLPVGDTEIDDQLGTHTLETKKTQLICLPANKHVCGDGDLDPGEQCDGILGACPGSCQGDCTCPVQPCEASTGGFCWFGGGDDQSCDTTCAANGRAYDAATASYAGSGGTFVNCAQVLFDLGFVFIASGEFACPSGSGCYFDTVGAAVRCTSPPTTSAATPGTGKQRACACQ